MSLRQSRLILKKSTQSQTRMSQNFLPNANSVPSVEKQLSVRETAAIVQRSPSALYQAIKASPPRLHYGDQCGA